MRVDPSSPSPLGVILAGGRSRRFGSPKALATVGGRTLVERVRDALAGAVRTIVVSGSDPAVARAAGLPLLPDLREGLGPLGGVLTALRRAVEEGRPGVLVAACDLPFVTPALFRLLAARGASSPAAAVVPESGGRRGVEPLAAWYAASALPVLEAMAAAGELRPHRLAEHAPVERIPLAELRRAGDPAHLFLNVNTMHDLRAAEERSVPPAVSVVGRKNAGKTTLTVALIAELRRRGWRVASVKHGHHAFESDEPGRDSWRHFNEGGAEATLMVGAGKVALTMRVEGEPDPEALIRAFYGGRGYDLVVVEGYKAGPFPKVEVFRRGRHERPLAAEGGDGFLAVVTDEAEPAAPVPAIPLDPGGAHVAAVADLLEARFLTPGAADAR
jgi:molybdopterin-guanine dinucleotide biosynthesis protein MobB